MKYLKVFTDFLEVAEGLSDGALARLFRAMLRYALDGTEPQMKSSERALWTVARQNIDRETAAYESKVEARREAGRKSGKVRREQSEQKGTNLNKTNQDKDKEKEKDNDNDKDNDFFSSGEGPKGPRLTAEKKETHPTLEEVVSFSQEMGMPVDAQLFFDYYEANGWRIGKNPMKDWKAAFRAWARNAPQKRPAPPGKRSYLDNFREAMELVCLEEAKEK
ncbi:MAG: hypothetical protein IJI97_04785 [Clostridia bacterium]|nr:hypothetical protein [Clostridia bacterium]MBQ3488164.1 hypothetical protein [Clostridia bacterium]MBQ6358258.1 hypothetical protein [Clostridia bacterium]MBQ6865557.1 hypothetical protein [Clostridia bacterium]MBQ9322695.1 hypothetical protein [Clostridia bacterium]